MSNVSALNIQTGCHAHKSTDAGDRKQDLLPSKFCFLGLKQRGRAPTENNK